MSQIRRLIRGDHDLLIWSEVVVGVDLRQLAAPRDSLVDTTENCWLLVGVRHRELREPSVSLRRDRGMVERRCQGVAGYHLLELRMRDGGEHARLLMKRLEFLAMALKSPGDSRILDRSIHGVG